MGYKSSSLLFSATLHPNYRLPGRALLPTRTVFWGRNLMVYV